MLFIENYDAQSLDRSSVSMIDKFNKRLSDVNILLERLLLLVDTLLSTIKQIRKIIGTSKTRIVGNLDQAKAVIGGNGITGAESTIAAIEDALAKGDEAISKAESQLETIKEAEECNQTPTEVITETDSCNEMSCGEISGIEPTPAEPTPTDSEDCSYCSFSSQTVDCGNDTQCSVCSQDGCVVNTSCDETTGIPSDAIDIVSGCTYSITTDATCNEASSTKGECDEVSCIHSGDAGSVENCTFSCSHESGCHESSMPPDCTYTCIDGAGCTYEGGDCSYSSTCGQSESCNQTECGQLDCGEPCGETCHMTSCEEDCSEEDSEGCGDCGDCGNCGEGDGCGDWSEFCGE